MPEYVWVLLAADGAEMRVTEPFPSKEEAEAWMGREWSALLEEGASSVSLRMGSEQLYEMELGEG
ncbi:MAG: hypothetical protein H0U53_07275 [Actinobacteria bacterium]|nr:hypothetical protein [Actinomycetota bacterium]